MKLPTKETAQNGSRWIAEKLSSLAIVFAIGLATWTLVRSVEAGETLVDHAAAIGYLREADTAQRQRVETLRNQIASVSAVLTETNKQLAVLNERLEALLRERKE